MQHLFVYGTLIFPDLVTVLTGKSFRYRPVTLYGFKRCKVIGCDYSAVVEESGSKVEEFVLEHVDEKSMEVLTFFEGDEYQKRQVTVCYSNKKIAVTTFVWAAGKRLLENRDWDASEFKRESLEYYLNEVIPETLATFRSLNA